MQRLPFCNRLKTPSSSHCIIWSASSLTPFWTARIMQFPNLLCWKTSSGNIFLTKQSWDKRTICMFRIWVNSNTMNQISFQQHLPVYSESPWAKTPRWSGQTWIFGRWPWMCVCFGAHSSLQIYWRLFFFSKKTMTRLFVVEKKSMLALSMLLDNLKIIWL